MNSGESLLRQHAQRDGRRLFLSPACVCHIHRAHQSMDFTPFGGNDNRRRIRNEVHPGPEGRHAVNESLAARYLLCMWFTRAVFLYDRLVSIGRGVLVEIHSRI